jgi:hypothetical protein
MNLKKIYLKISRRLKKFFIGKSDFEELDCPDFILEEGEYLGPDPELSDIQYYWSVIKKRVTERSFSLK